VIAAGTTFTCTPTAVWDGDGPIWCAEGPKIRLAGIAAREIDESCKPQHPCPAASGVAARDRLVPMIAEIIAARPAANWLDELERAGIPAGPINTISQALADVQAVHRGTRFDLGGVPMVGSPVRIDGERNDASLPPPWLGEHGAEILERFADTEEIERLRAAGIVA
jgi:crotonobetainyl-CoA:carnitine CoA-transferase CaiB-like acyl-CoA transferase